MLPPDKRTFWARRPRGWAAALLSGALAVAAGSGVRPALALDGRVDVSTTHQEGRSGDEAISSDDLWQLIGLDEMARLSRRSTFQLQYLARREILRGTAAGATVDNVIVLQNPSANLSWQSDGFRANLYGRGSRMDQDYAGSPTLRDDNLEYGLWSTARGGLATFDLSFYDSASWRRGVDADRENRERVGNANLRLDLSRHDDVQFRYSRVDLDAVTNGHRTTFQTSQVKYRGDRSFSSQRGRLSWTLLHSRFDQRDRYDRESGQQYILPITGGYWVDDTPELLDPLENQPEQVPALFDNDRNTPTVINLGDNTPPGRDVGGDYRNIYLDFGEPREMAAAFLQVDRRLTFIPDVFQWDLYFCDEAEGSDWGSPVPAGSWTVRYVELETGNQGWEIRFASSVTHRRLKLVDRKLGPTMGDLFVTEFEILQNISDLPPETGSRQDRTMLEGEFDYRLHPRLQFRYGATLDRRTMFGAAGNQDRANQTATLGWRLDGWLLTGQVQLADEESPSQLSTRSNSRMVSLARQAPGRLSARFAWTRVEDDNYNARYVTEAAAADATWRAAPLLSFNQKVTRGWRVSDYGTGDSDSWITTTQIRSVPRPGLRLDLSRTNRWVSREAGSGFTSYGETQVDGGWEIRPLLYWWGQYVSQKRDERDWILRNTLSWTPLPGGSVALTLQANDYQDSRVDQLRRGGGASVEWQARPRLLLSAGVDKSYERLEGRKSWPFSYQARGYWTF